MGLKFFNLSCRRQRLFDGAQRYLSLFVLNAKMTFSDKDLTFLLMSLSRLPMASLPHHDHFDITATPHRCIIYFPFCLSTPEPNLSFSPRDGQIMLTRPFAKTNKGRGK